MAIDISDFVSVEDRAIELGCLVPTRLAILPENFSTAAARQDLLFGQEASTLRKVFRNNDFALQELLPAGEKVPSRHNKHFEWAPLLFISAGLISQDPNAVSVALGIVSNYATDFFKGMPTKKVKLTIVVERKRDRVCKKVTYEGDISGIEKLPPVIQSISDE